MKKILVLVSLIAIGVLSYYFYNQNNTQVSTELYEYVKIEKGSIKKVVSATGKIIPTSTLILSSEISGKIVEIKKDYNEKINKGDVLAIFDQNPFILNVDETETSVEISKSTWSHALRPPKVTVRFFVSKIFVILLPHRL